MDRDFVARLRRAWAAFWAEPGCCESPVHSVIWSQWPEPTDTAGVTFGPPVNLPALWPPVVYPEFREVKPRA